MTIVFSISNNTIGGLSGSRIVTFDCCEHETLNGSFSFSLSKGGTFKIGNSVYFIRQY